MCFLFAFSFVFQVPAAWVALPSSNDDAFGIYSRRDNMTLKFPFIAIEDPLNGTRTQQKSLSNIKTRRI